MASQNLRVQAGEDGAVVQFTGKRLDDSNVEAVGERLSRLVDELDQLSLQLDLGSVEFMSSVGLGKLVALHEKVRRAGGQLTLCNVDALVYQVFEATSLVGVLDVRQKQAE